MTGISDASELFKTCLEYLVLGIIQGITEFLPISSTAHLKVIPMLLGWGDPGISITAVIQLGSIISVFIYFKNDLSKILKSIRNSIRYQNWREPKTRLGIAIIIGSFPILFAGVLIKLFWPNFDNSFLRSIPSIGIVSIFSAIFLYISERIGYQEKSINKVSVADGLIIGMSQILALIPGASRSGITLSAALIKGWKREDAARFSFLIGIPAITLAGLVELKNALLSEFAVNTSIIPLCVGIASSAIVSWISIDWLIKYLQKNNAAIFIQYRLLFGLLTITWWVWEIYN